MKENRLQMRALVTGCAGFIGSTLCERLLHEGYSVIGIDSFTEYYDITQKRANASTLTTHDRFTMIEGDVTTLRLHELIENVDFVFHLAGQPGVRASWGRTFDSYVTSNVLATQRLLEAVKSSNSRVQRFVYASSSSVYGNASRYPTVETDLPLPISPYGVTKLAAEHLCQLYGKEFNIPTVSLRYFTVYGPRQRPDMAFARFLRAAALREQLTIYGNGSQIRDFTFVDDIVQANLLAATTDVAPGTVLNVSGGSNVSINEILDLITEVAACKLHIKHIQRFAGDVHQTGGSMDAIRATLGWNPHVSLRTGLRSQYQWVLSNLNRHSIHGTTRARTPA